MRSPPHLLFVSALALASVSPAIASPPPGAEVTQQAELRSTLQFDLHSHINGETYRVQILIPRRAPPPGGYPTLYVLDGDALFGGYAQAMANRSGANEVAAALIVGIAGAPGEHGASRTLDFTFSDMTSHEKDIIKDLGPNPPFGGADRFFQVIQQEIRPRVAKLAPVDPARGALLGWSLGGHFVMHTMFEHPEAFGTYIALSPALWRSDRILFKAIPGFAQKVEAAGARPRLFIGAGSREEEAFPGMMAGQMSHEDLAKSLSYARMVGNASDMAADLQPIFASHAMGFKARVFEGDTHNSMPWSAINPVLDFAFPRAQ